MGAGLLAAVWLRGGGAEWSWAGLGRAGPDWGRPLVA